MLLKFQGTGSVFRSMKMWFSLKAAVQDNMETNQDSKNSTKEDCKTSDR